MAVFTALTTWATTALTSLGFSAVAASAVLRIGGSLAINALLGQFAAKTPRQQVQATINQSAGPRVRAYGLVKLGGTRALFETENDYLHQIVVAHQGRVNQLVSFMIDGKSVGNTPGEIAAAPWKGGVKFDFRDGAGNGGSYSEVASAFPGVWTADHRLTGLATFWARMKAPSPENFAKVYPKGSGTEFHIIVEGSLLYDPRYGTTAYNNNAALVVRDHLTSPDGWNIPAAMIDDDAVSIAANRCAEMIPLAAGGTERRYRIGGYYTLDEECKTTLGRILTACDGQVIMTAEGKLAPLIGGWSVPDVTLDDDDIIEIEIEDGRDPFGEYNIQKGVFIDPSNDFQETEVDERIDTVALATQPARATEFRSDMCPSFTQLRRLMAIQWMRDRREWVGTIRTKMSGIKARYPKGDGAHIIRVIWSELDINGLFEVTSWTLDPESMQCIIGIASVENAWAWTTAQEGAPPTKIADLPMPSTRSIPLPTGLAVQQEIIILSGVYAIAGSTTQAVRLVASVNDPGSPSLRPIFEYRPADDTGAPWVSMNVSAEGYIAKSGPVDDNTTFEVRARFVGGTAFTFNTPWAGPLEITTLANPIAPSPPTNLSQSVAGGNVTIGWKNSTAKARVFRSSTNDFSGASGVGTFDGVPGEFRTFVDDPGSGTWYYWVVALNQSYVASSAAGPLTAAVT